MSLRLPPPLSLMYVLCGQGPQKAIDFLLKETEKSKNGSTLLPKSAENDQRNQEVETTELAETAEANKSSKEADTLERAGNEKQHPEALDHADTDTTTAITELCQQELKQPETVNSQPLQEGSGEAISVGHDLAEEPSTTNEETPSTDNSTHTDASLATPTV